MTTYEKISFEEATRILYYHYGSKPALFTQLMEDLMNYSETPYKSVSPKWYDDYKQNISDNKKSK